MRAKKDNEGIEAGKIKQIRPGGKTRFRTDKGAKEVLTLIEQN